MQKKQLPPPDNCDSCQSDRIGLTSNSVLYGIEKGEWPYCYYCDDCGAMVGCHPNTHNPMGLMAVASIRRKRAKLHEAFDPIWQLRYLSRDDAYKWLAKELDLPDNEDCHIGLLSPSNLNLALNLMRAHSSNNYIQFKRRKEKNATRQRERYARQNDKIGRRKSG